MVGMGRGGVGWEKEWVAVSGEGCYVCMIVCAGAVGARITISFVGGLEADVMKEFFITVVWSM